jgi:K+-transporting ATPase KdpF subunit
MRRGFAKPGALQCLMSSFSWWVPHFSAPAWPTHLPAIICEGLAMIFDYVLGGVVTVFLLGYLVFALIRPERF